MGIGPPPDWVATLWLAEAWSVPPWIIERDCSDLWARRLWAYRAAMRKKDKPPPKPGTRVLI